MNQNQINQIALTKIKGINLTQKKKLLDSIENIEDLFSNTPKELQEKYNLRESVIEKIEEPQLMSSVEEEISFIEKHQIGTFFYKTQDYSHRLALCNDAPLVLYSKGNINLNAKRIVGIVGTRRSTTHGRQITEKLVKELADIDPEILIVSGLAYGIDIVAHKTALEMGMPTVAVLAHGLHRIYPSNHQNTALKMMQHGGIITEFSHREEPERYNFIARNRIIAGLSDAIIVVESYRKGGALITAQLANSYNRPVFTFPARINDSSFEGCLNLLKKQQATLITSGYEFANEMLWLKKEKQQTITFQTEPPQSPIILFLKEHETPHINELAYHTGLSIPKITELLFEYELNGWIKSLPGNRYCLRIL